MYVFMYVRMYLRYEDAAIKTSLLKHLQWGCVKSYHLGEVVMVGLGGVGDVGGFRSKFGKI